MPPVGAVLTGSRQRMLQDLFFKRASPPDAPTTTGVDARASGTIADRYEILRVIGDGGMGRVFVAYDRSLKRNVAIKVLAPQLAKHPRFSRQLLREARAAAQLHHPNIVAIYDVVESDGALCIVMELLGGETLADRLRRRRLDRRQAMKYARQIAAALKHAHAHGIVHCDLKPGNIFITQDDDIKVLDFGLARMANAADSQASDGIGASAALIAARPGTPGYMPPEQVLGLPLDERADVYTFGLVLHEMFTGRRYGADSSLPGPPSTTGPAGTDVPAGVPAPLRPILERALADDPAARFQSVGELETALERALSGGAASASRHYLLLAAVLALAVAGMLALLRPFSRTPPAAPLDAVVVGVPAFASTSTDRSLAFLASGLSELVAAELGASNAVAPRSLVAATPDDARSLATELGAGALVLGTVGRAADGITVGVRVYAAGAGSFTGGVTFTRSPDDLPGLHRSLISSVRSQLATAGFHIRESPQRPAENVERLLPRTMGSFEEYAEARWFLERIDVDANIDSALTLLERLVAREPTFALGYASLGEAAWRKWQATRDPAWSEAAQRHAFEALRLSGNQPEVRYAVALIYQGTGRASEALAELEAVARSRPLNDDVQRMIGRLHADAGRLDEGLRALNRAIELRPGYWGNHAALGNAAFRAGRYDLAERAFRRFTELRPDSASAHQRLGVTYHAMGNIPAALASYERAIKISPNANAYSNIGTIHFDEGRYGDAIQAYTRATELEPRNASLRRNLADALRRSGRAREARRSYERALELAADVLRVNPRDELALSLRAVCLARTGRLADADAASREAVALAPRDSDVLFEHGIVLLLQGRKDEAVEAIGKAVGAGYSIGRLKADRDLGPLADHPGFRRIVGDQR